MRTFLIDMAVYVLMVLGVALVMVSVGYAMDLGPIDDPFNFGDVRDRTRMYPEPDPRPRVESWLDNSGGVMYLFNYGRVTMPVPLEQLTHPEKGPTFDPFGVIGQDTRDTGWLEMPKRRTK